MSTNRPEARPPADLASRGMIAVLASQFLSALADNALLFAALALLKQEHHPAWAAPLIQEFFVGAYIVLAPFVGPFADSMPKGRVMLLANALKLTGGLGMFLGLNPFLAYGLVGVGGAAFSPAKYGILSELTSADRLVKANSLMESFTIGAILVGTVAGGTLADWSVEGALAVVAICYGLAAATTLLIPRLEPAHRLAEFSLSAILIDFRDVMRELLRVTDARFIIVGTSLFLGAGATMRFLLVAWVPVAFGVANNRVPAYLNAMIGVGIVAGAALAAKFVTIEKAERALPAGVLIGVVVCLLSGTTSLPIGFALMALIGACGGFFVVPLNALLQEKGHQTVGSGHAIAVQNLAENSTMLVMIGLYSLIIRAGAPIGDVAVGFGAALSVAIATIWAHWSRKRALSA